MKQYTKFSRILQRLAAVLLAFLFLITPFAPVFAQEVIEQPISEPVVEAPQTEVPNPVISKPIPEITENPALEEPAADPEEATPAEEEKTEESEKSKPKDEEPIDPGQEEGLMAQPGPELDLAASTVKSGLPEVDKASGALVFNYLINIPPGRNGMEPDLALVYNSQGGEIGKAFGDRWSLDLPYIERINRKGTDKLYTEDLFASSIDGELVDLGSGVFRPKVQNSEFIKYEYASSAWIATDKKGIKYKFGTTASSRLDNPSDSTKIYRWMIDDLRDLNKNYIKYEYYKDNGAIYPSRIVYTGNDVTDGIFEVEFTRTAQSEPVVSAKPGFTTTTTYHITEILISINDSWARKYTLAYTAADNGQDTALNTVTETGRDESSNTIAMPAEDFDYQMPTGSGSAWTLDPTGDSNWNAPADTKDGIIIADANGDGLDDFIQGLATSQEYKRTWLNTGSGWSLSNDFVPPIIFKNDTVDEGVRGVDVNGDGLVDLVRRKSGLTTVTYLNNGTGWTSTTNWLSPEDLAGSTDPGTRFGDFNGDGLPDIIKNDDALYLNNGTTGWTSTPWTIPVDVEEGVLIADANGDGLDDLMQSWTPNGTTFYQKTWLNNGQGWTLSSDYVPPVLFADQSLVDGGVRAVDANGDGLVDLMKKIDGSSGVTYLNDGDGWTSTTYWNAPLSFILSDSSATDTGTRLGDFDGDGKVDFIDADAGGSVSTNLYFHSKTKANLLSKVTYPRAGFTDITYQGSGKYMSGSTLLNPSLPMILVTVKSITHDDGFNTDSSATYTYEGGKYYFNTAHDRKFAGFSKITKVDAAGNKVKTFYHQGDSTNSSQGEFSDHVSKIGKIYRVELTDSSDSIYVKKVSKWENYDLGSGRNFVKLARTTELTYDGDSDHKDKTSTYTYDDANGNITQQVDWGEVTGSDDGSYTDTGSDKFTTDITYASNTTYNILGLPKQETVTDQSSNKVRENKYYYDLQAHDSVNVGNLTKEEKWKTGSTYIDYEKTYNTTYGIVTSEKDPRDKTTSYSYDSYNLYPATVTNALSQATSYTYDYSLGKAKQVTDPNTRVFQTVYDALDRVIEEKQPDLTTPSTLVTKSAYTYTGQTIGNKIQKTDYLDGNVTVDTITYTDGFDRPIQVRKEHEDSNTFSVTDTIYNNIEQINKESLAYSSTGTSKTTATTTTALLITYSYDPMYRVTTRVDAAGTVTNAYDDWKHTITDARSKNKYLYKDAYGNLTKVEETNSGSTYTTLYEYNGNGKLTKITDALSNIRNFTYDGLGRRLTAQDLHASADTSFGTWTYTYDDSGNLTSVTDPKSQQIDYTYDDINRRLTENYTGQAGTEVTYTYDSGTDGTGRLTSVTATGANTTYVYNPHGKVKQETKTINSTNYQTDYTFDRQGNVLEIINPDSSKVQYNYNTAGQLETVKRKESTDGSFINLITDLDYGPHGKITSQTYTNGVTVANTYDATKLYRLSRKYSTVAGGAPQTVTETYYPAAGDGHIYLRDASWNTVHDATAGSNVSYESEYTGIRVGYISTGYHIQRAFLPFDTSALPDDADITDVKLKIRVEAKDNDDNDGNDFITVVQATQASTSSLVTGDFDQAGSIDNPTEGINTSERKDITSISTGQDLTFTFNATGRTWVSKTSATKLALREGHDVLDDVYGSTTSPESNEVQFLGSETSGTSNDPRLEVTYETGGGTLVLQDINYTYDANGNITQITDDSETAASKSVAYVYDDLNRLTSATATNVASGQSTYTKTYTYNAIGNITAGDAGTYTYAGDQGSSYANPHAVTATSTGTKSYTYDNNGNLLTVTSGLTNTWDYNNRLTEAVLGSVTSTYAYDHEGQRVKLANGTTTTYYPSKFYNIEGSNRVKHIFAGDQLVATVTGTGGSAAVYSVHADHLTGSNVITDSGGEQEELMDYFPFGGIRIDQKAASFGEQRKFAGHEYDADTQLNYMTARYYKSDLGRFISQDPVFLETKFDLSDPQGLNAYAYSRNNPLRYADPDGQAFRDYVNAVGGYGVGLLQGAGNAAIGLGNAALHPVQTLNNTGTLLANGYSAGKQLAGDLYNNPGQTWNEISTGVGLSYNEFETKSSYEQGKAIGNIFGQIEVGVATSYGVSKVASAESAAARPTISSAYKRPANATTAAQRASVQGKACVNCGQVAPKMVADHKVPLVKEYYQTGKIDLNAMRNVNSVQPQCPSCSAQQGGFLSNFSKQMKSFFGFK